jgi:hypothetical protein
MKPKPENNIGGMLLLLAWLIVIINLFLNS